MDNKHVVVELLTRVLCDSRPVMPVDGVYLNCQTTSSQGGVFQTAKFLLDKSYAAKALILHIDAKSGYPGFDKWSEQLQKTGINQEQIEGVESGETESINTLIESEALVRFALKRKYRAIVVVAPPFQQLRAFMTAVTVALREYPQLRIYSYPAVAMPWQEEIVHSQGTLKAIPSELIHAELARINTYQKKGDLSLFEPILAYLNQRQDIVRN
ncbi:MAG: hypothetical protein JKY62_06210 [Desulfocapsa sp.]|uniref:DUF218 domain-containing protein n=1 Tax=Desulfotalea psychrophila TaxID=84980 RepID=A0ABS3AUI7_9BACT|nr:hypothetical protein [Desulfocapsa sp.]MBN4068754.1 hypothetical protein [Desulfotalea psychrophila]